MHKQKSQRRSCARALVIFALITMASAARAQMQTRAGVRAEAMGGAFAAVSNDVSGLQFSPAGLLNSFKRWQLEFGRHRLFANLPGEDLALNSAGGMYNISKVYPNKDRLLPVLASTAEFVPEAAEIVGADTLQHRFSLGAHWLNLSLPGSLTQNTFMLAAGIGLWPQRSLVLSDWQGKPQIPNLISVALTGRYIHFGYNQDYLKDPAHVNPDRRDAELQAITSFLDRNNISAGDFALDASLFFFYSRQLQFAISVLNLRQPVFASGAGSSQEGARAGRRYRAGVAFRPAGNLVAALDVEKNDDAPGLWQNINVYAGAEYLFQNRFAPVFLRGGGNRNWISAGAGLPVGWNFMINGVYQYNLHGDAFHNYRFAISYGGR